MREYPDPRYAAMEYLHCADEEDRAKSRKNRARDWLKENLRSLGEPDENGNFIWEFDHIPSGDGYCTGLKLQRRVSEYLNEDKAGFLIGSKGLGSRCIRMEPVLDINELYVCNQEGLITDEEMDELMEVDELWALVKIKS
jgi:hypothetical protein